MQKNKFLACQKIHAKKEFNVNVKIIFFSYKGQEMDFGVNYVTSYSKRYDKSSGLVHLSVLVDVPESGPTLAVYWQVNEGVVGGEQHLTRFMYSFCNARYLYTCMNYLKNMHSLINI